MGWNGSGCDMASLTVGAFASAATAIGRSYALIFVDVKAAYDSTNKRLALPTDDAGEWIRRSVLEMGFSDLEAVEIADEGLRTLEWGGASFDGTASIAVQRVGVAAGVPLADVTFGIVISRIARRIRQRLADASLLASFESPDVQHSIGIAPPTATAASFAPEDVSYVDDSVFMQYDYADLLCDRTARTMGIIEDTYARHGFPSVSSPKRPPSSLPF
jgi:hypothetical protein